VARLKHVIEVTYSCQGCGLRERPVRVQERFAEEELVGGWMAYVTQTVTNDHFRVSPLCREPACELTIPLASRAAPVGQAQRRRHSG
jgi:hypothetical protein